MGHASFRILTRGGILNGPCSMARYSQRILIAAFLLFAWSFADSAYGAEKDSAIALSTGYRKDNLDWNIAGNRGGTNPDVLSELKWRDMETFDVKLSARTFYEESYYFRGWADYGWILSDGNQDSDFNGNGRTLEYSRSNNKADGGSAWDLSGAAGFRKRL